MSSAPFLALASLLALAGCSHAPGPPTTPPSAAPAPTPDAAPSPPRVRIALGAGGASVTVDDGDPERCVSIAEQSICGEGALPPEALGAHLLEGGWVLDARALRAEGEVSLRVDEGVERLGPVAGDALAYLSPGAHTQRLGTLGWIDLPPSDEAVPGLERFERAAQAVEAQLGAPRWQILLLPGAEPAPAVVNTEDDAAVFRAWLVGLDWWERGLGAYLTTLMHHRAGALSTAGAYDDLLARYARHRDAPGESPASAEGPVAADVGALVAYCVDVDLRTQNTSLVEQLARLGDEALRADAFRTLLEREHPAIARRHHGRAQRRGVLELDSCLRRAGRKLIAHEVPVVDPARLLRVGEVAEDGRVERAGAGPLRPGDVVRHVRGRAVRKAWDIVFFLRDLEGRHRFSVSVQRGERTVRTWLRMVSLDDDLPTRIRFTATEDSEADDEADPFRAPLDERR